MKPNLFQRSALSLAVFLTSLVSAFAQPVDPIGPGRVYREDTQTLTCRQAHAIVRNTPEGAVLYSGALFDRYYANERVCYALRQTIRPALVPTRDTPQCLIGYTCIEEDY
jgi:hypothetical protein